VKTGAAQFVDVYQISVLRSRHYSSHGDIEMKKVNSGVSDKPVFGHFSDMNAGAVAPVANLKLNSGITPSRRFDAAPPSSSVESILEFQLRESAEKLIFAAMELEVRIFRAQCGGHCDADGREMIVRNGFQPARTLSTVIGCVSVRIPKLRRRDGARVTFRSIFVPHYVRRVEAVKAARQCEYLSAIRSRDVAAAIEALFNGRIRYVPSAVLRALRAWWAQHCEETLVNYKPRDLESSGEVWADALTGTRPEHGSHYCVLALVGADKFKRRRFLSLAEVDRSSAAAWSEVLRDLKHDELPASPKILHSARAVGFDEAYSNVFAQPILHSALEAGLFDKINLGEVYSNE
jgi:transposase-like protein